MKSVLIIHYHFLPVHNVGVKQFLGYGKYLPEFGWRPVVLTKNWGDEIGPEDEGWGLSVDRSLEARYASSLAIYRSEAGVYWNPLLGAHEWLKRRSGPGTSPISRLFFTPPRRVLSLAAPFFSALPDRFVGWCAPAEKVAREAISKEAVTAILSDCPPETNHLVASRVARRTGLPWIPYFGDLYGFGFGPGDFYGSAWRRLLAHQIRKRWLRPARKALATSPGTLTFLSDYYGLSGELVVVGYDEQDFVGRERSKNAKMKLAHVGSIYPETQRPELLLEGLADLGKRLPRALEEIEVRFVGSKCDAWLTERVRELGLQGSCLIHPKVPADEAIRILRSSDALLLFNLTGERSRYGTLSYPSKIFEYFGSRRPILATPGDGDWVDTLLETSRAGVRANDPLEASKILERWYQQWRSSGSLPYEGREDEIAKYTHREQARRIASVLDEVTGAARERQAA